MLWIKAEILEAVSKKRSVMLPAFNTRHSCLQRHHSHGAVLHLRNSLTVVVALAERADICLKACSVKFYSPFWMPSSHPSFLSSHTAQDGCSLDEKWASSEWLPSWRRIMPAEQSLPGPELSTHSRSCSSVISLQPLPTLASVQRLSQSQVWVISRQPLQFSVHLHELCVMNQHI